MGECTSQYSLPLIDSDVFPHCLQLIDNGLDLIVLELVLQRRNKGLRFLYSLRAEIGHSSELVLL